MKMAHIEQVTREACIALDCTIDAVVVIDDDHAYVVAYEPICVRFWLYEGRNEEGKGWRWRARSAYPSIVQAIVGLGLVAEGMEIVTEAAGA